MELKFRNALAHGMFGLKGKNIILYKDAKFSILETLNLADFMVRSKRQNVLTICLFNVIARKKRHGFFT